MQERTVTYDDASVRRFLWASVLWGAVGMLVGVIIASQLAFWQLNGNGSLPWIQFGRLRPLHTNAVIFAFVGNMIFAGVYYSSQRLLKTRMASDLLSKIHFWGWQLIIVAAAISLPLGLTQGKEYAELEWYIDIAIALIWVAFAVNFFWTLAIRNEKNLYVALWFYIASILTVAVLHIVNSLALPSEALHSYSVFGGVQDALVQWWYGHNAVAFFLTTPVLGIMYYFLPKAIGKPIYSYRLSIVHFWALVFLYIWAGPHHLLNSALPEWAQNLGTVFSVMLWAPSWGGMINGLLTLRGAWDKLRTDPVIKFFAAAITFYGMSTFEGPMMSIRSVNALAHNTDWVISHVHGGALGWNGFMAAGMFYWLVPKLYGSKLHSERMANLHFWLGMVGIVFYMAAMYVSGITQGLMWRALTPEGTLLYPDFLESIAASRTMYMLRLVGGLLYLSTFLLMAWNLVKTARAGKATVVSTQVSVETAAEGPSNLRLLRSPVIGLTLLGFALAMALGLRGTPAGVTSLIAIAAFVLLVIRLRARGAGMVDGRPWHELLEGKALLFTVLALVAVLIGGMVQILPMVFSDKAVAMERTALPYTPLELAGRDIYRREGCYVCHTQMVRPLVAETLRYGDPSEAWESMYDHPFQWGSKRTGPDLARVGGKYPDLWHYRHMQDPRSTSQGSIMPSYAFLADTRLDTARIPRVMNTMRKLGVPYDAAAIEGAVDQAESQAVAIADGLTAEGETAAPDTELIALIAYLQKLGADHKIQP
ncbi:MAG: cytochrome-c oxidase, cbb3-type subunit I [Caldilineae bacterium]|nr:cytochrome-c oxidase, cbb3-type subunit I [Chloroflexota bacterium]MCB9176349.1 cytochrome-c oxidase, cbb3-type subunit I [Caldilineae bacterium]